MLALDYIVIALKMLLYNVVVITRVHYAGTGLHCNGIPALIGSPSHGETLPTVGIEISPHCNPMQCNIVTLYSSELHYNAL